MYVNPVPKNRSNIINKQTSFCTHRNNTCLSLVKRLHSPKSSTSRNRLPEGKGYLTKLNSFSYSYNPNAWNQVDYNFSPKNFENDQRHSNNSQSDMGSWIPIIKRGFNAIVNGVSNLACQVAPAWISKKTVNAGVKAGLILLCLVLARAVLSLVITCTMIFSGVYLAFRFANRKNEDLPNVSRNPEPPVLPRGYPYGPHPYYQPSPYNWYGMDMRQTGGVSYTGRQDLLTAWREPYNPYILPPPPPGAYQTPYYYDQPKNENNNQKPSE